jgi:hypothetical protein
VHAETVQEPGLDQHEWQTQWEALEPELADAPGEALPELARLVDGMLEERGYESGTDPEIDRELELGREIVDLIEGGDAVDPGDIGAAVNAYRNVFAQLIEEHRAP